MRKVFVVVALLLIGAGVLMFLWGGDSLSFPGFPGKDDATPDMGALAEMGGEIAPPPAVPPTTTGGGEFAIPPLVKKGWGSFWGWTKKMYGVWASRDIFPALKKGEPLRGGAIALTVLDFFLVGGAVLLAGSLGLVVFKISTIVAKLTGLPSVGRRGKDLVGGSLFGWLDTSLFRGDTTIQAVFWLVIVAVSALVASHLFLSGRTRDVVSTIISSLSATIAVVVAVGRLFTGVGTLVDTVVVALGQFVTALFRVVALVTKIVILMIMVIVPLLALFIPEALGGNLSQASFVSILSSLDLLWKTVISLGVVVTVVVTAHRLGIWEEPLRRGEDEGSFLWGEEDEGSFLWGEEDDDLRVRVLERILGLDSREEPTEQ